jgi:hypothetical protein
MVATIKRFLLVGLCAAITSGCTSMDELIIKQNRSLFNDVPEHQGQNLQAAVNLVPVLFPSSADYCAAAMESKFSPKNKSPDGYLLRIKEVEQLMKHTKFGTIEGRFVKYNGESRAFGISCNLNTYLELAKFYCEEVAGKHCIVVAHTWGLVDFMPSLYEGLAEARRRVKLTKAPEGPQEALGRIEETCSNFGFDKGTEKFADCMKDLYLKETNSEQQSVQNNSSTDAQLQVLRQQLELQRQQAAAAAEAEKRRQGFELMNQGLNTLNPSPPPSNRPLTCRTMSNGITTCQ